VALLLRPWERDSAAIRLAYVHNLGDMYVSLAPVAAGVLVTATGYSIFDPVFALAIGVWLLSTTLQELRKSGEALLWPEDASCPHPEGERHRMGSFRGPAAR
jgi:cobalt-zinc-cadmium efflux system protein